MTPLALALLLAGCRVDEPDCGRCDGQLWAGAAAVDITPVVETFEDLDGDGSRDEDEPFEDLDGDGLFDPVWMGGFDNGRQAHGVHDPLWARTVVLERDADRLVLVVLDLVGLMANRVTAAKRTLESELGIAPSQVIIASTHTHDGPDSIGFWGPSFGESGRDGDYMDRLESAVHAAVLEACSTLEPATARLGFEQVPDVHGCQDPDEAPECAEDLVRDGGGIGSPGRDPLVIDPSLAVLQLLAQDGERTVATLVDFAAHPEILWDDNHLLSSDFPHFVREELETAFGGTAIYVSGALGGMMTPTVRDHSSEEMARFGRARGARAVDLVQGAAQTRVDRLSVQADYAFFPVEDKELATMAGQLGVLELEEDDLVHTLQECEERFGAYGCTEAELAPCAEEVSVFGDWMAKGCVPVMVQLVTVGEASMATVPGELLPELAVGLPADFPTYEPLETRPNAYFPQHEADEPLEQHVSPYVIESPLQGMLDSPFPFIIGLANHEGGYFVPEIDYVPISLLDEEHGDHYEESVSMGYRSATVLTEKLSELAGQR